MSKIRIKNFGPIKEGFKETLPDGTVNEWIDVKKVTVFIGNQGSGKSTVAKLISTMTWIEKALVRGDFNEKNLKTKKFKDHIAYQNIGNYFKENTIIEYSGKAYSILYEQGKIKATKKDDNGYSFPKIMYVPSERNFASSVKNVYELRGLPKTLYTFSDEDKNAKEDLKEPLELPINNSKFEYRQPSGVSWIVGSDYEIKLSEASSGFHSFVPLYIVSRYLALFINKDRDPSVKEISIDDRLRIREEIKKIESNPKLSEDVKMVLFEKISSRIKYTSFINIVEEPEQNLFPSSQRHILNSLLEFNNMNVGNKLIVTTHSPYLINYLTLAVKANDVFNKLKPKMDEPEAHHLDEIVPMGSMVDSKDLIIYELNESDGTIIMLAEYNGLPSDENYLNESLEVSNELFAQLLEIQQGL